VTIESGVKEYVQCLYDRQAQREWERMDRHRTEFALTLRALAEHLPPAPAHVLDCGGGPGRYAIELARNGYAVTLFDLSPGCLQLAQEKAAETGVTLASFEQGSATDLSCFPANSFDAVLLMGPLYHLLEESERRQVAAEAYRVLRPGGPLLAAFITRYAPLRYVAANAPNWPMGNPELLQSLLEVGNLPPRGEAGAAFVAHFAHPDAAVSLVQGAGFDVAAVLGVEGVVSMLEEYEGGVNTLDGAAWETWVELNWRVAPDPTLHGGVEHLLVVGRKPRWRAVLRRVALRLEEAGIIYTVVGGAVAALHGLPLPVNDLDIETDAPGAYRFQELFVDELTEPVSLRESTAYRSHFGRFIIDGVAVEVMGDLKRREDDRWVPTSAQTQTTINLDGVAVRVAWLEEEILSYIRRRKLERAAACLPHCDHGRLLALLRGQMQTGVL